MKLTRERKLLLALVGLGVLAFIADRVLFGPPQSASASPVAGVADVTVGIVGTGVPVGEVLPTGMTIADRLNALLGAETEQRGVGRDAFVPSKQWLRQARLTNVHQPADALLEKFRADHRLLAVMVSGNARIALVKARVNGETQDITLSVGEVINGFELIAVRVEGKDRSARFLSKAGRSFVLHVPKPQ